MWFCARQKRHYIPSVKETQGQIKISHNRGNCQQQTALGRQVSHIQKSSLSVGEDSNNSNLSNNLLGELTLLGKELAGEVLTDWVSSLQIAH